jgi:DNA polymerase III epsilon subunit-like protein
MANREIFAPIRRRRMLVFDVETTGKINKGKPVSEQPHIIQLSFVVYDLAEHCVVRTFDSYIKIGSDVELSDFICEFTGASRAKCDAGIDIVDALKTFYDAYSWCDGLVAHNIEFDTQLIAFELERNRSRFLDLAPYCLSIFNQDLEKVRGMERYCTMKKGTKMCALPTTLAKAFVKLPAIGQAPMDPSSNLHSSLMDMVTIDLAKTPTNVVSTKRTNYKWPKLTELHEKLFGQLPGVSHNSMADVNACLRCYLKMRHGYDVGTMKV